MSDKQCTKCGQVKSLEEFCRAKKGKDGRAAQCKECDRRWRQRNTERLRAYERQRHKDNPNRSLEYKRKRRQEKAEELREYQRLYRQRNKKHIDETIRRWCEENKDRLAVAKRRWYEANKERVTLYQQRYREENKERRAEYHRRYVQENRERIAELKHLRRALEQEAEGQFTAQQFRVLCEKHGNRCLRCGEANLLEADHVVPLSQGGTNYIDNIQPLCRACNASKGAKTIDYR